MLKRLVLVVGCVGFLTHSLLAQPAGPAPPVGLFAFVDLGATVRLGWIAPFGSTVTGYQIEAGTGPGLSDRAVLRIGTSTSFQAVAPPGVYFVRVRTVSALALSAPSNEIIVTVRAPRQPAPPTVHVIRETASLTVGADGRAILVGEVHNRADHVAIGVVVGAELVDRAGVVLGSSATNIQGRSRRLLSGEVRATESALAPSESGCFYLETTIPAQIVADVRFQVNYEQRPSEPYPSDVVLFGPFLVIAFPDGLQMNGQLFNRGPGLTYWNRAVIYTQRADGKAAGCDAGLVSGSRVRLRDGTITDTGLRPGEMAQFTIESLVPSQDPRFLTFTAWALWDEGRALEEERR